MTRTLIIAEAGVNHNGRLDLALQLCDAAKKAGADVVKFQTWITEKLITKNVSQADYQAKNTGVTESQYDMLKKLELSHDDFRKIKEHCDKIGIQFATTVDEKWSLDFVCGLGLPFLKIGSGDITNIPFLRMQGEKHLPIILSTGMSSLSDVDIAVRTLQESGCGKLTLLHCTTNYPCPFEQVNLSAMLTLKNAFHLPVGYSDHTIGIEVPIAAVALGAEVIEKHFTIDRNWDGPDHLASTEPTEFKKMVESIRNIETAMGDGIKTPTQSEKDISKVVLKRIVALKNISAGDILSVENVCVKRNDTGVPAQYWDLINGTMAKKDYKIDDPIEL